MRRRAACALLWSAALGATAGCETPSAGEPVPAVLTQPSAATRAELSRAVRAALNGVPVRLADDALTQDSALVVERVEPRDAAGLPFNGRELDRPEHFHLAKQGPHCILLHERSGRQWTLRSATCMRLAARG